VIDLL